MRLKALGVGFAGLVVAIAACSSESSEQACDGDCTSGDTDAGNDSGGDAASVSGANLTVRVQVPTVAPMTLFGGQSIMGNTGLAGLESLRQYITQIYICDTLDVTGSAFTPTDEHCLITYDRIPPADLAWNAALPDFVGLATRAAATEDGYVDLMNSTSRATLTHAAALRPQHAHEYNYGYITWVPAIKFRTKLTMSDGSTWYSHPGTPTTMTAGGFTSEVTVTTTPFTTAPAEDAVVVQTNGGAFFRFQHPLVISEGDIANNRSFVLDLAFSPENLVRGGDSTLINGNGQLADAPFPTDGVSPGPHVIAPPFLAVTPIPHQATEHAQREVYSATVTSGGESFEARVELYTITEDQTHTIYGVNTKTVNTAGTVGRVGDFQKVYSLVTDDNGKLVFRGIDSDLVGAFTRVDTVGGTTTASLYCSKWSETGPHGPMGAMPFDACPDTHAIDVTFKLTSIDAL